MILQKKINYVKKGSYQRALLKFKIQLLSMSHTIAYIDGVLLIENSILRASVIANKWLINFKGYCCYLLSIIWI